MQVSIFINYLKIFKDIKIKKYNFALELTPTTYLFNTVYRRQHFVLTMDELHRKSFVHCFVNVYVCFVYYYTFIIIYLIEIAKYVRIIA